MRIGSEKGKRIIEYCFLSSFVALPFLELFSSLSLALLLFAGIFLKDKKDVLKRIKEHRGMLLLLAYFLLAVVSLSYTSDSGKTFDKIGKHITFVLVPLGFLLIGPSHDLIEKTKKVFLYACILFCLVSLSTLAYNYIINHDISHWYNFVQSSMYHKYMPEDAMLLNTALVFLLFGNYNKNVKLIVSALFLTVIILFGVRLGLAINLVIIGAYCILNLKQLLNIRSLLIGLSGLAFCVVLIKASPYVSDKFYDSLEKIGFNTSSQVSDIGEEYHDISLRNKMWSSAVELIKEKPIIGYGGGVEKNELAAVYKRKGYDLPRFNAHSQPLSTLLQFGVVGLIVLLLIFIALFKKTIKLRSVPLFLVVFVMLVSMTTESYLELQEGTFYFCLFSALILVINPKTEQKI